jgi:DNA polymerase III delta prime subunit
MLPWETHFEPPAPSQMVPDPRVWRMITAAVASAPAVMLVGPPGTGKSTLVSDVVASVFADPSRFGLSAPPSGVDTHTPDEGWDTRTLIGGETVDDQGRLRFRAGRLLEAIREDRWLVLDEANRADLDRILGPALTWLAGGNVSLGTAGNALDAAEVRLEWDLEAPRSYCDGWEYLEEGTGGTIRFVANASWRLLGTYNAVDAQRVFRFGQALGRRFQRVPVPAAGAVAFAEALFDAMPEFPEGLDPNALADRIERLYAAHCGSDSPLGPAVFLRIPYYLKAATRDMDAAEAQAAAGQLLAEAYVLAAGGALVHLDPDELSAFGQPLVADGVLDAEEWAWVVQAIQALG